MWVKVLGVIAIMMAYSTYAAVGNQDAKHSESTHPSLTEEVVRAFSRPSEIPIPENNSHSLEKLQLGKMLFFDIRLSRNRNISCASCHDPSFGWESPTERAIGISNTPLKRHAPTLLNLAWQEHFFWDGRAQSLEDQVQGPIEHPDEMGMPMQKVVALLNQIGGYRNRFERVFDDGITETNIQKAIAHFERTIVAGTAPFDRWIEGDSDAISLSAQRGFSLFTGKAQCIACHTGWAFTDGRFHDLGFLDDDLGKPGEGFKTPTLRNINLRAPYMHHGKLKTLRSVIGHYMGGGLDKSRVSPLMQPIALTPDEIDDLIAFMHTLTGEDPPIAVPTLPQ